MRILRQKASGKQTHNESERVQPHSGGNKRRPIPFRPALHGRRGREQRRRAGLLCHPMGTPRRGSCRQSQRLPDADAVPTADRPLPTTEKTGFVRIDTRKRIQPSQRMLLLLRDMEGYSYKEMADITGLSDEQVMTYLYRARVRARKYLTENR